MLCMEIAYCIVLSLQCPVTTKSGFATDSDLASLRGSICV